MKTKDEIEKIKEAGAKKQLLEITSSKLWEAKRACEDANIDHFKNFLREINKATKALSDAKQLFEEANKIP